jgi:hypothetical protein
LEDWPAISSFINDCYGDASPYKGHARWQWQFVDTPYDPIGDTPVSVWIALHGDRVAGQLAIQPGRMMLEGAPEPAGWIVDVMIRPEYRGYGLGHRIHDAIVASGATVVTLTMALATRKIAERAGAVTLGPVYQMVRPLRLSGRTLTTVLERSVERRAGLTRFAGRCLLGSRVIPAAMASAISVGGHLLRGPRPTHAHLNTGDAVAAPLEEIAALFEANRSKIPALFDRGRDFLDWRFNRVPDLDYRWVESRRGDGQLMAAAAWRLPEPIELPIGTVVEVAASPDDASAMEAVIDAAVSRMAPSTEGVIAGASHPAHVAALRRNGFRVVKTHYPTVVTRDAALASRVESLGPWHFTKADHDWDQVHPAHE